MGGAYAQDKNTSARLCTKSAGGRLCTKRAYLQDTIHVVLYKKKTSHISLLSVLMAVYDTTRIAFSIRSVHFCKSFEQLLWLLGHRLFAQQACTAFMPFMMLGLFSTQDYFVLYNWKQANQFMNQWPVYELVKFAFVSQHVHRQKCHALDLPSAGIQCLFETYRLLASWPNLQPVYKQGKQLFKIQQVIIAIHSSSIIIHVSQVPLTSRMWSNVHVCTSFSPSSAGRAIPCSAVCGHATSTHTVINYNGNYFNFQLFSQCRLFTRSHCGYGYLLWSVFPLLFGASTGYLTQKLYWHILCEFMTLATPTQ